MKNFKEFDQAITLPDGKVTSFSDLLIIDRDNLAQEFAEHAAWLGYIGILTAEAEEAYETAKQSAETLYAEKDADARLTFNSKNLKFTETMVKNYVELDNDYISAQQYKIGCYKVYKLMRAIEASMREKGSMLVSLGATVRQEMDMTDLRTRLGSRDSHL